eukprot:COSAG02_NODE_2287_length_9213_cov_5.663375_3_plen_2061_part_01
MLRSSLLLAVGVISVTHSHNMTMGTRQLQATPCLTISAVFDGPMTGGLPKGVELYASCDVADLSAYGIGSANNGGGTDGEEYTFPAGDTATAGDYIIVSTETEEFQAFFGFAPDYTTSHMGVNGDDAVELFMEDQVIDLYGAIDTDGTGEPWDYLDSWVYRNDGAGPSATFDMTEWHIAGVNALDGLTANNGLIPLATYQAAPPPPPDPCTTGLELSEPGPIAMDGYSASSQCTWTMACPEGSMPKVTFSSFDLEAGYDYVHVYLDGSTAGTAAASLHGSGDVPDPVVGTGTVLALELESDGSMQGSGFAADFTCQSNPCYGDGVALNEPGPIAMDGYSASSQCTWTMTCPEGQLPTVAFSSFDVEANWDFVHVYLNGDIDADIDTSLHGDNQIPDPVVAESNMLALQLDADGSGQGTGFDATFSCVAAPSACTTGLQLNEPGPFVLDGYDGHDTCTWTMTCPEGLSPMVAFNSFDVEANWDFVHVYLNGDIDADIDTSLHGDNQIPDPVVAESNMLALQLDADGSVQGTGFDATFSCMHPACVGADDSTPCDDGDVSTVDDVCTAGLCVGVAPDPCVHGVTLEDSGQLSLPPYGANMACMWTLTCSDMASVPQITFTALSTEANFDFVELHSMPNYAASEATYSWIDISTSGNLVDEWEGNTDDGYFVAQLGFSVSVYGVVESEITIGTNGYVTFGTDHFAYGNNEEIPFVTYVDGIVAPFWIDLDLSSSGEVRYQAMSDSFVVSWLNVPYSTGSGNLENINTFQLIVRIDGSMTVQWQSLMPDTTDQDHTANPSIGLESGDGELYLNVAYGWDDVPTAPAAIDLTPTDYSTSWDLRLHGTDLPDSPIASTGSVSTVRFVSDVSVHGDGFEADFACVPAPPPPPPSACTTGIVLIDTGTVTQGPYETNMDCSWTLVCLNIDLSPELTFTSFETESGWDFVSVYLSGGGGMLGVADASLSGSSLPPVQVADSNVLRTRFQSDGSGNANGFEFEFRCVDAGPHPPAPDCVGTDLVLDWSGGFHASGHATFGANVIHSPSFDNVEIAMADPREGCQALVNDVNEKVALILRGSCLFTTKVLNAQTAGAVAVVIYNNSPGTLVMGGSDNSITIPAMFIDQRHGEQLNSAIVSGTTTVSMHCGTESVNGAPGIPPDPCSGDGLELLDSGEVSKVAYGGNVDCNWKLECSVPEESPLLTFSTFATEGGYDYLYMYDAAEIVPGAEPARTLHGEALPAPFMATGDVMLVNFQSDGWVGHNGFQASFQCVNASTHVPTAPPTGPCTGGVDLVDSGSVTQEAYQGSMDCSWRMSCSDPTLSPLLTFDSFATEGTYDYLYLYYDYINRPSPDATLHGTELPEPQFSSTNTAIARFVSDGFVGHNGFSAAFTCIDASTLIPPPPPPPDPCTVGLELAYPDCLESADGCTVTKSPYPNDAYCTWTMTCTESSDEILLAPQLTFASFQTEGNFDYLYMLLEEESSITNPDLSLHGSLLSNEVTSTSSTLTAVLISDGSVAGEGFTASFACVDPSVVPPPPPSACTTGLDLVYEDCVNTESGCAFGQAGYNMALECSWTLTCSDDTLSPQISFTMLDTEGNYDFVDLYFSDSTAGNPDARLHGSVAPEPQNGWGNTAVVVFDSDSSFHGDGFAASFDCIDAGPAPPPTACGEGVELVNSGTLQVCHDDGCDSSSAGYDGHALCTWRLTCADVDLSPQLSFQSFDTEGNYDFVYLYFSDDTTGTPDEILHGSDVPDPQHGWGNVATVVFDADGWLAGAGFEAEFACIDAGPQPPPLPTSDPCTDGAELVDLGIIAQATYSANLDCTWTMTCSDSTLSPQLEFSSFNTESIWDNLYLYYSHNTEQAPDVTLHGTDIPPTQVATGYVATARFASDFTTNHDGFEAVFSCVDAPCLTVTCPEPSSVCKVRGVCTGGTCSAETDFPDGSGCDDGNDATVLDQCTAGVCQGVTPTACTTGLQLNEPGPFVLDGYDGHNTCTWTMTCPEGLSPMVAFNSFDVEANWDFVHVYLNGDIDADIDTSLHGDNQIPDPVVAESNMLALQLDADGSGQGTGFDATF